MDIRKFSPLFGGWRDIDVMLVTGGVLLTGGDPCRPARAFVPLDVDIGNGHAFVLDARRLADAGDVSRIVVPRGDGAIYSVGLYGDRGFTFMDARQLMRAPEVLRHGELLDLGDVDMTIIFRELAPFMANKESRPYLDGIFVGPTCGGETIAVATDGHRMRIRTLGTRLPAMFFSRWTVCQANRLGGAVNAVSRAGDRIVVEVGGVLIEDYLAHLAAIYPDAMRIWRKHVAQNNVMLAVLDIPALRKALRPASRFKGRRLRFRFAGDSLEIGILPSDDWRLTTQAEDSITVPASVEIEPGFGDDVVVDFMGDTIVPVLRAPGISPVFKLKQDRMAVIGDDVLVASY